MNVTSEEVDQAYDNWLIVAREHLNEGYSFSQGWNDFWRYVGHPHFPVRAKDVQKSYYPMSQDSHRKVQMLLSPHHATVIKAWYILKEAPLKITIQPR